MTETVLKLKKGPWLLAVFVLAAGLRLYGITWGIPGGAEGPRYYHPDERMAPLVLSRMRPEKGEFNPLYFINPTFYYYSYGLVLWPVAALTNITPPWKVESYVAFTEQAPGDQRIWFLTGRLLTVLMSLVTVWGVYELGNLLANWRVGILAAAIFAVMPAHVLQSHYMVVDAPALMWMVLSLAFFVSALNLKSTGRFAASGIFLGLGVATKYTTALVVLPQLVLLVQEAWPRPGAKEKKGKPGQPGKSTAAFITGWLIERWRWLLAWAGLAAAGFSGGCPYALLDWRNFVGAGGLGGLRQYNAFGFDPVQVFRISFFYGLGLPLMLLALAGLVLTLARPRRKVFAVGIISTFNTLLLIANASPYLRHFVPLTPFLAIAGAYLAVELAEGRLFELAPLRRKLILAGSAVVFLYSAAYSTALVRQMGRLDNRTACAQWLKNTAVQNSVIAVIKPEWGDDFYSVLIDENQYARVVTGFNYKLLEAYSPDYLILSDYEKLDCPEMENGESFIRKLEHSTFFAPVKIFPRDISLLGLPFPYDPPGFDWFYFCPEVTVYGPRQPLGKSRELFRQGRKAFGQEKDTVAIDLLNQAAELEPANPIYRLYLARAMVGHALNLLDRQQYYAAAELLDKAQWHTQMGLNDDPRIWIRVQLLGAQAQTRMNLGIVLARLKKNDIAERAFLACLEDLKSQKTSMDSLNNARLKSWSDNYKGLLAGLAYFYMTDGRLEDAEKRVNELLELDANYLQGLFLLADVKLRKGAEKREVREILKQALNIDPSLIKQRETPLGTIFNDLMSRAQ